MPLLSLHLGESILICDDISIQVLDMRAIRYGSDQELPKISQYFGKKFTKKLDQSFLILKSIIDETMKDYLIGLLVTLCFLPKTIPAVFTGLADFIAIQIVAPKVCWKTTCNWLITIFGWFEKQLEPTTDTNISGYCLSKQLQITHQIPSEQYLGFRPHLTGMEILVELGENAARFPFLPEE